MLNKRDMLLLWFRNCSERFGQSFWCSCLVFLADAFYSHSVLVPENNKLDGGDDLSCMLSHGVSILPRCRCIMERLACKEAIIISAAGRTFLRPREEFRRVREWFSGVWH